MKKRFMLFIILVCTFLLVSCSKDNMITNITLNESSIALNVGENKDLVATITPEKATNNVLTWTSSDPMIATVTNGRVMGVKYGETSITVSDSSKKITKTCKVKVNVKDYTWDGTIPEEKPETLKVKDDKETYKLENGNEIAMEVLEISKLNEFIYFFQKAKLDDIFATKAVIIRLTHDMYLNGKTWTPSNFMSSNDDYNYNIIFDGNKKSIVDFKTDGEKSGFLDVTTEGYMQIKDLDIRSAEIVGTGSYTGVVNGNSTGNVSYKGCNIENCKISGKKYVGGLCPYGKATSIIDCNVKNVTITIDPNDTTYNVGALIGLMNAGKIENCNFENVNITASENTLNDTAKRVGIIAGVIQSEVVLAGEIGIKNCKINNAAVTTNEKVIFLDNRENKDYTVIKFS